MKKTRLFAMTSALATALLAVPSTPALGNDARALPNVAYNAYGFGSRANLVNGVITSGPTGYSIVACTTVAPKTKSNSVASVTIPLVGTVAALSSTSKAQATPSMKSANAIGQTGAVSLFGGTITAGALKTTTAVNVNPASKLTTVQTATLANLTINGVPISASTAPNTTVMLKAGSLTVAKVVVNKRVVTKTATRASATTTALDITLLAGNPFGLPTGAVVRLGLSTASLDLIPAPAIFSGNGYSTQVRTAAGLIKSGPTALAYVPCTGGSKTANVASVTIPGLLSTGTTTTTTNGSYSSGTATATVTQSIAAVNLLAGLVTVDAIVADTSASRSPSGVVTLGDTSHFVGLGILGLPLIGDNVAPNTTVSLLGVGSLTLHEQVKDPATGKITVTMLKLVLNNSIAGLPTGTIIELGYSSSGVAR